MRLSGELLMTMKIDHEEPNWLDHHRPPASGAAPALAQTTPSNRSSR
jgi:hypothetical protein